MFQENLNKILDSITECKQDTVNSLTLFSERLEKSSKSYQELLDFYSTHIWSDTNSYLTRFIKRLQ